MLHQCRKITYSLFSIFLPILLMQIVLSSMTVPNASAQWDSFVVALDPSFPPFAWKNDKGELEGFDIDLMNALAAEAGLNITYETVQFRYLLSGMVARLYDIGGGCIFTNDERAKIVNFSKPYFATGDVLVVQAQETIIQQTSDLTDTMTVGVIQGTLSEEYGRNQIQVELLPMTSMQDAFTQLNDGALNAVIADEESLFGYQQKHPEAKLKTVGGLLTYQECGFAVEKSNTELLIKLNAALTQIKDSGAYEKLYRKWFGERPLHEKPTEAPTEVTPDASTSTMLASTNPITFAPANVVGIYYLSVPDSPPSSAAPSQGDSYQIVTLAANGLWFTSQLVANAPNGTAPLASNQQATGNDAQNSPPGLWWINDQQQIEATQLLFRSVFISETVGATNVAVVLRQSYQMTTTVDGNMAGFYTTATYAASDFAQSPTATPLITQTVEFTGWRVR